MFGESEAVVPGAGGRKRKRGGVKVLVIGSTGHFGAALVRSLRHAGHEVAGLDLLQFPFTTYVGSIADRGIGRMVLEPCA